MGIGLRPRQVTRELDRLKKQAFKDGAQYRRFLKEAHYTHRDVRDRVEIQLFSERIQRRVVAGLNGKGATQVFAEFVMKYKERWRSRTLCAPGYITDRCSNGSAG